MFVSNNNMQSISEQRLLKVRHFEGKMSYLCNKILEVLRSFVTHYMRFSHKQDVDIIRALT